MKIQCVYCLSDKTEQINVTKESSYYNYCRSCGTIFLNDHTLFDQYKYTENYTNQLDNNRSMYFSLYNYLRSAIIPEQLMNSKCKFLEIGFSNLGILLNLNKHYWDVTGLDIVCSDKNKKELKDNNIKVIISNILESELTEQYDLIWMSHVIEHFKLIDMGKLLDKLRTNLTSNGKIFISAPNAALYGTDYTRLVIDHLKPAEHATILTPESFYHLIEEHGYKRNWFMTYTDPIPNNFEYQTKGEWRFCISKK